MRLGIVGLGRGAVLTAPALAAHPRIEIVAGCDPGADARAGFAAQMKARSYADLETLLCDPEIDAVYIASPHESHAAHTVAAARAGKHVLVEKPMAVTLANAARMAEAARAAGTVLMVGPSHGYDAPVALAADLIADGTAGAAHMIHAFAYTDFLYRPRRPAELLRAEGGGVVLSQGSHQVDVVRRLAGSRVKTVRAWVGDWDAARRADGAFTALLTFENGAAAGLVYSGYARYDSDARAGWAGELGMPKTPGTQARTRAALAAGNEGAAKTARGFAAGAEAVRAPYHERLGSVIACCANADLELTPEGVVVHGDAGPELRMAPLPPVRRYGVADAFARAVLDGERPLFDGAWGLETLAVLHALLKSAVEGRDISPADLIDAERSMP
nr:Gfo/Idh/MocA family oxidoreductase [Sphingosinicella soli]